VIREGLETAGSVRSPSASPVAAVGRGELTRRTPSRAWPIPFGSRFRRRGGKQFTRRDSGAASDLHRGGTPASSRLLLRSPRRDEARSSGPRVSHVRDRRNRALLRSRPRKCASARLAAQASSPPHAPLRAWAVREPELRQRRAIAVEWRGRDAADSSSARARRVAAFDEGRRCDAPQSPTLLKRRLPKAWNSIRSRRHWLESSGVSLGHPRRHAELAGSVDRAEGATESASEEGHRQERARPAPAWPSSKAVALLTSFAVPLAGREQTRRL
jgi:hypothetical protein